MTIIAMILVMVSVIGSYVLMGGKLGVLNQPFEVVIIFGSGMSAFFVANPISTAIKSLKKMKGAFSGSQYKKEDYLTLLCTLYEFLKLMKQKGSMAIEAHVENPKSSNIFEKYPKILADHHALDFLCDYLRMISMGTDNAIEIESVMEKELELHHAEHHIYAHALNALGDSFPALGIVAAVLGVIKTMGAISEPPEVLGGLIAGALVGTFLGILLCYGWFGPLANASKLVMEEESCYQGCIKSAIIAYLQGYAPSIAVEIARKSILDPIRPSFKDVDEKISNL